jgi:hypothetical protein
VKRVAAIAAVAAGAFVALVPPVSSTTGATQAVRVVDRTMLCATRPNGGIYEIQAESYSGVRQSGKWLRLPFANVTTGQTGSAATVLQNAFAWVTSGQPDAETQLGEYRFPVRAAVYGTLAVNRRVCRPAKRIPFTTAGLRGGVAGQLGDSFDCAVPRRVVVRVRAVLTSPTALQAHDAFLLTTVAVSEARLAVRTQKGKPVVYMTTAASGRSTIFTRKGCIPE